MNPILTRCFVTRNAKAPIVCIIGDWPTRAALVKVCRAGIRIGTRHATRDECEADRTSVRPCARMFRSLKEYLRFNRRRFGKPGMQWAHEGLRKRWNEISGILAEGRKKTTAKNAKSAKVNF